MRHCFLLSLTLLLVGFTSFTSAADKKETKLDTSRGDRMIADYFERQTVQLRDACLEEFKTLDQWKARRGQLRGELLEMLGLNPLPEKTDLKAEVTGKTEHDEFFVERVHFQSRPGLYVTGNLYVPKKIDKPLPAILYVCGHGSVKVDGVSYGNKAFYQHHGAWFARNGYVCLIIDSHQLAEIEAIHHGTYRYNMWWWLNRGYTPAGVEAWNCVRALDYLETRKEVDPQRFGVTGRSGGGAYSWWIAAIDERIKAAVPVAGITDLENHVIDGTVEGHCDCMFMVNTFRWDYPQVAALVAPRPLLISNTDRDGIFPLEGVFRTHAKTRKIYNLYGASEKLALHITAGPHKDTQELRIHAFRWFDQHLKGEDRLLNKTAEKLFKPEQLQVFKKLPKDQKNTAIQETFVAAAAVPQPVTNTEQWGKTRDGWRTALLEKSFRGWPQQSPPLNLKEVFSVERQGVQLQAFDFTSQAGIQLRLYLAKRAGLEKPDLTVLNVLDQQGWNDFLAAMRPAFAEEFKDEAVGEPDAEAFKENQKMFQSFKWAMAYVAPRGVGPTAWDQSQRKQTQHRRRFYLLGQSLDGMRVWDVRRASQALRAIQSTAEAPLWLQSEGTMGGIALYASLFEPEITRLDLYNLPTTHRNGPFLLNVRRYLDMPQAVAMAAERSKVVLYHSDPQGWEYATETAKRLKWKSRGLQIRKPPME